MLTVEQLAERESWRDIAGYEGRYRVSNHARVMSVERKIKAGYGSKRTLHGRILRQVTNGRGYLNVKLGSPPRNTKEVHRLVALAFCLGWSKGLVVNHINGNRTDNRPSNLEWCTKQQDCQHAQDMGLNLARYSERQKEAARRNLGRTYSHIIHAEGVRQCR